jgi:surfeit locus 1 family protein
MQSRLHSIRFWLLTSAALAVAGGTFSLGQWQLGRADEKETAQAAIASSQTLPALDERALLAALTAPSAGAGSAASYRRVLLQGVWQPAHTVYLDNRPMGGRSGFWVLTPLVLQGSTQAVLVQRGWVPRDFLDRTRLPPVTTPAGVVSIEGRMAPPPSRLYAFKGEDTGLLRQNLDMNAFRLETGLPLLDGSVLQTGPASEGLLREWAPPALGVEKHHGYAFQWFALCTLVLGLYAWFQLILPFRASSPALRSD